MDREDEDAGALKQRSRTSRVFDDSAHEADAAASSMTEQLSPNAKTDPVGSSVDDEHAEAMADEDERAEHERLAAFEMLARLVIMRRAQLGISQADLARRMKTSPSVVSRIESGHHPTNTATLKRVAEALQGRALLGFDFATAGESADRREFVTL